MDRQGSKWVEIRECDYYEMSERMRTAEQERDSLKQQIVELDKSTDDLQFKVKAVERLVGVLEKKLVERDTACADMRRALEATVKALEILHPKMNPDEPCVIYEAWQKAKTALSSSAGRDLLERVRYLEQGHQLLKDLLDDVYMLDPMGSGNRVLSGPPKRSLVDTVDAHLEGGGKDA